MKEIENLLITVLEECSEVQQAVSKSLRFGLDNHHPERLSTNKEEIMIEYYQLISMIELLQENDVLPKFSEKDITEIKINKINQVKEWLKVSMGLDNVT